MRIFWKKFNRTAATALTCGLLAMTTSGAWAQDKPELVGRVIDIDGPTLKTNRMKEDKWYQAYPSMNTYLKERMIATKDTTATIQFAAGGRAVIASGTQVEVMSPRKLKIVSGTAWLQFDKDRLNKEEFQIETSGGVMGIEGTEFIVRTDEETGKTELTVIEGAVGYDGTSYKPGARAIFGNTPLEVAEYAAYNTPTSALRDLALKDVDPEVRNVVGRALWYVPGRYRMNRYFYSREFYYARSALRMMAGKRAATREGARLVGNEVGGHGGSAIRGAGRLMGKKRVPVNSVRAEGTNPLITWKDGGKSKVSVVVAEDSEGENVVWYGVGSGKKKQIQYPAYGPTLDASKRYYVFVTPMDKEGKPKNEEGRPLAGDSTFSAQGHTPTYQAVSGVTTNASSGAPEFTWKPVKGAVAYKVAVKGESGSAIWTEEASTTTYTYPETARALAAGNYAVEVEAYDATGNKMAESRPSTFASSGWDSSGLAGPARAQEDASLDLRDVASNVSWLMDEITKKGL